MKLKSSWNELSMSAVGADSQQVLSASTS